jgi:hypothetical protein
MNFELELNEAAHLINTLARLPNETMTYPLVVKLKEQFDQHQHRQMNRQK